MTATVTPTNRMMFIATTIIIRFSSGGMDYFIPLRLGAFSGFPAFIAALRAVLSAIATACFCDIPGLLFISLEMFSETVFLL